MNRADFILHLNDPETVRVQALFTANAMPLCNPDLLSIRLHDGVCVLATPEAAIELASQLTAHLAGLARRDKEATA